jgi:hypothetical protein
VNRAVVAASPCSDRLQSSLVFASFSYLTNHPFTVTVHS